MYYILAIGSFQGILLFFLLFWGSKNTNASRILGVWCLFLAFSFLGEFLIKENEINHFTFLAGWSSFLPASYGAFLYLYCKHAIAEHPFKLTDFLHAVPVILCYALNVDLLFASPQSKLDLFFIGPPDSIRLTLSILLMFLQAFVYLAISAALIRKFQQKAKHTLSSFNPDIFNWLWKVLFLNLVIWSLNALANYLVDDSILSSIGDALIVILIYSIAMAQWRNPGIFVIDQLTVLPSKQIDDATNSLDIEDEESLVEDQAVSKGALDDDIRSSLLKVVREHMLNNQTYLDNKLTLTSLADVVGVSTHHLSETLNQHGSLNFYQFINEYRIEYICNRLKEDQTVKILDLAMTAGFSSKSTFNAVFKQITGFTPSQYRRNLFS